MLEGITISIFSQIDNFRKPTKPQKLRKSIVKFTSDIKKSIRKSNIKYALDSYLIVNFRLDLKIN